MATAATDAQAERMMREWLLSPEHFCIAPKGDYAGLKDTCYWCVNRAAARRPLFFPFHL